MRCAKTFATPHALIIGLSLAGAARAGILFDFNNQSDAGLTRINPLAGVENQPGGSFTFPLLAPGNYGYELASPGVPSALVPAIGRARLYSFDTAVSLTNFSTSADIVGWNDTRAEAFGVGGGRATSASAPPTATPPSTSPRRAKVGTRGCWSSTGSPTKMRPTSLTSR